MTLTRDQILGADDFETREVEIEKWGGKIRLKSMNGLEREQLENKIQRFNRSANIPAKGVVRAVALVMCAVDENGNAVFTDEDVEALAKKSGAALDEAFEHILEMNGMSKKDAEELEKN